MIQSITRSPDHPVSRWSVAAFVVIAATMVALARGLPAHTFYAGDSGVKLIATRQAVDSPSRPFEIPLPHIDGTPVPFVEPFFLVHGNHSHAVTPELFPLLTAPFVALGGVRGAYVLPALGALLAFAATAWLARLLDRRRSGAAVMLMLFLGTPLFFYGLELWEHAPAAGVAALAAALFVRALENDTPGAGAARRFGPTFGAGVCFGLAVLLRPEALWFAVALFAASKLLRSRPPAVHVVVAAAGLVAALVPLTLYTLQHFGHPIPPHVTGNPSLVTGDWSSLRQTLAYTWLIAGGKSSFWRVAPAILLAFVWRPTSRAGTGARRGRPFLLVSAALTIGLVLLTAPNDGGAQWGPRYLLLAYLPLSILATDTITYVVRLILAIRRARHSGLRFGRFGTQLVFTAAVAAAVASLGVGSVWLQRAAYRELRGSKLTYARLVDFVERHAPPGRAVVTDLWWVDQVAASLTDSRRFFSVTTPEMAADALRRLDESGEPAVTLLRSPIDSPGHFTDWTKGTCYQFESERGDGEGLIAIQLARSCQGR
jgi:hypothetical protein